MGVKVRKDPKDGAYYIRIHHKNRRTSKKIGVGDKARKRAESIAEKIRAKLVLGEFSLDVPTAPSVPLVEEYSKNWLAEYGKQNLRESTVEGYTDLLEHYVYPCIGAKRLDEVTREDDVKRLIRTMSKGGIRKKPLAYDTIRLTIAPIREIFEQAVEEKLITRNPFAKIGKLLKKPKLDPRLKIQFYSESEVRLFLEKAAEMAAHWYTLFLALFFAGLRIGEAKGLQFGGIDFAGRFIEIRRTYSKKRIGPPKNGKLRRVDISPVLTQKLQEVRDMREAEAALAGKVLALTDWVFLNSEGSPIDESNVRRTLHRIQKAAGLQRIRVHDTRHTYASILIGRGESLAYVKEQMGHSSIKITVDTYGHLVPGANRGAADRLDSILAHPNASQAQAKQNGVAIGDRNPALPLVELGGFEPPTS